MSGSKCPLRQVRRHAARAPTLRAPVSCELRVARKVVRQPMYAIAHMHTGEGSRAPVLPAVQVSSGQFRSSGHQVIRFRPGPQSKETSGASCFPPCEFTAALASFGRSGRADVPNHRPQARLVPCACEFAGLRFALQVRQSAAAYVPVWQHFERVNGFLAGVQLSVQAQSLGHQASGSCRAILRRIGAKKTENSGNDLSLVGDLSNVKAW